MADRADSGDLIEKAGIEALEFAVDLIGASVPGVGVAAQGIVGKIRQEHQRRRSVALRAAERASGLSREEIAERVAGEPGLLSLVTRVLFAAGMNGHDATLKAMGAALGHAAADPGTADEAEILLTSLADLTDHHAWTLLLLSRDSGSGGDYQAWTMQRLEESSDLAPRVTSLCVAALVARGLAEVSGDFFGGTSLYRITRLGRDSLAVLREYVEPVA